MFVDEVEIEIDAGDGGNGCCSFRRERYVSKGGPDGGDGGNGGSVYITATPGVDSLTELAHRKCWRADRGGHGEGSMRHGKNGTDIVIRVPPGTIVRDGTHKFVLKDLIHEGDQVLAARGGRGGKGNTRFKSSTHQAPRETTPGGAGEHRRVILELKMIADVGLIGLPNAGKSTLLSRLSHARPRIADYPFTTRHPNLGRVDVDRDYGFLMADIPGLIEGAHLGVGLGHEFLRHVERTRTLVHLVEPEPQDRTDPLQNYLTIRDELREYDVDLTTRTEIVAISKGELPSALEQQQRLAEHLGQPVLLISAVTGAGLRELVYKLAQNLRAE
ncbi:MAG: GTPase ObgE [Planctomycetota bacterium]|nr:GTPase ObgE [Planctomycetota bacterium]MDA1178483.1 GTPase ObgE [Planctomycetota bacterium]